MWEPQFVEDKQFMGSVSRPREHLLPGFTKPVSVEKQTHGTHVHGPRLRSPRPHPARFQLHPPGSVLRGGPQGRPMTHDAHRAARHAPELLQTKRPVRRDGPRGPLLQDLRTQGQKAQGRRLSRSFQDVRTPPSGRAECFPFPAVLFGAECSFSDLASSVRSLQGAQVGLTGPGVRERRPGPRPAAPGRRRSPPGILHFISYIVSDTDL